MQFGDDPRHTDFSVDARAAVEDELVALAGVGVALLTAERRAQALGRVLDAISVAALEQPEVARGMEGERFDAGRFAYIPGDVQGFLQMLFELDALLAADRDYASADLRYRPVRFLEVGCGPGRNLQIVRQSGVLIWAVAQGFDIVAPYVLAARQVFGLGDSVWQDDAAKYDYSRHDVVFSFRPFSDEAQQSEFELHLVETMPVGGYLLAPLSDSHPDDRRLLGVGTSGNIWKKLG